MPRGQLSLTTPRDPQHGGVRRWGGEQLQLRAAAWGKQAFALTLRALRVRRSLRVLRRHWRRITPREIEPK